MKTREATVAVVSETPASRLIVVLKESSAKPIVIRTQTYSDKVGWFTQQEIELTRSEFKGLRNVLGIPVAQPCKRAVAAVEQNDSEVAILSFAAAQRRRA